MSRMSQCKVITKEHETLDFTDDQNQKVHLERTKAYVFLPYSTLPDVVYFMEHRPLGEGTIDLEVYIKKEQLRARFNVDSLVVKPSTTEKAS